MAISTNNIFMLKALSTHHIYDKCIPNIRNLISFSKINKTTNDLVDGSPLVRIDNTGNPNLFTIDVGLFDEKFAGTFLNKLFENEDKFMEKVNQLSDSFCQKMTYLRLQINNTLDDVELVKSRLKILADMLNNLFRRTTNLVDIKLAFEVNEHYEIYLLSRHNHTDPELNGLNHGSQPHFNQNMIIDFICLLKITNIEKMELMNYWPPVCLEILKHYKSFETKLMAKFKKMEKFLICFDTQVDSYGNRANVILNQFFETLDSKLFKISIEYEYGGSLDFFNFRRLLRNIGKNNHLFVTVGLTPIIEISDLNKHEMSQNNERFLLSTDYFDFTELILRNPTAETFNNLKQLTIDYRKFQSGLGHEKSIYNSEIGIASIRSTLLSMTKLKILTLTISSEFTDIELESLFAFVCAFPNTVEYLTIPLIFGDNTQLNTAFPNLKFLNYHLSGRNDFIKVDSIPRDFLMCLKNLEVLSLCCIGNNKFIFPRNLKKIVIDCQINFIKEQKEEAVIKETMEQNYNGLKHFKLILQKIPDYKKCFCCEQFLKHVHISRSITNQIIYTYFKSTNDFDLCNKYYEEQLINPEERDFMEDSSEVYAV